MKLKQNTKIFLQKDLTEIEFTEPIETYPRLTDSGFYRQEYRKQQSSLSMSTRAKNKKPFQPLIQR